LPRLRAHCPSASFAMIGLRTSRRFAAATWSSARSASGRASTCLSKHHTHTAQPNSCATAPHSTYSIELHAPLRRYNGINMNNCFSCDQPVCLSHSITQHRDSITQLLDRITQHRDSITQLRYRQHRTSHPLRLWEPVTSRSQTSRSCRHNPSAPVASDLKTVSSCPART
jgi:hypothetical protein